jgi:hypothetical protein
VEDVAQKDINGPLGPAIRSEMQTALLLRILFPPPAAGALVFAGKDGARTRVAADAGVAGGVERVLREISFAGIREHIGRRPIGERADLHRRGRAIEIFDPGARFVLRTPEARIISRYTAHAAGERPHFSDIATESPVRDAVPEQIPTVKRYHRFDFTGIRQDSLDTDSVARFDRADHPVSRLGQTAGVERQYGSPRRGFEDEIEDDDAFALKAGEDRERTLELRGSGADNLLRGYNGSRKDQASTFPITIMSTA